MEEREKSRRRQRLRRSKSRAVGDSSLVKLVPAGLARLSLDVAAAAPVELEE